MLTFKKLSLLILVVFSVGLHAQGQTETFQKDSVYSTILKENRPLRIYFPKNFKENPTRPCDVLYVLDGEWNTSLAQTLYGFLEYGKFIPTDMLIVGVPNTYVKDVNLRDRDFTPSRADWSPRSGGAADFLSFLKKELIPYIDQKYPTRKGNSTLYGTSLGGLFGIYAFLYEPTLFKSYVTVEPSLWWDNRSLVKTAVEKMKQMKDVQSTLWIASRDGRDYREMGVEAMDSVLKNFAPAGLSWKVETYANETHFTAIWKGVFDGMKFSYAGHLPEGRIRVNPTNGIVAKGKPFKFFCSNLASERVLRYTTDGSEPGNGSSELVYEQSLTFVQPTMLIAKSVSVRKEYVSTVRGEFDVVDALPGIPKPKGVKSGGLRYTCYKGNWDQMPDLKKIKPTQSGIFGKDFDPGSIGNSATTAWLLEGFVEIPEEGYYIFEMRDDNHVKAFVAGHLVTGHFNVPGGWAAFIMPLQKGFYPIRIEYLTKKDGRPQPFLWRPLEKNDTEIPLELLYGKS